jgi:hypothetical protein
MNDGSWDQDENPVRPRKFLVSSFARIPFPAALTVLELDGSKITNFEGIPWMPRLLNMSLNSTRLSSFKGAFQLPSLSWVSYRRTPLSRSIYHKLMCLIAFGPHVATINEEQVSNELKRRGDALRAPCASWLHEGYLMSSLVPLRFSTPKPSSQPQNVESSVATLCEEFVTGKRQSPDDALNAFKNEIDTLRERFSVCTSSGNSRNLTPSASPAPSETSEEPLR